MDPLADTLIQIKNAGKIRKETVVLPYSRFKHAVLTALLKEGYIASLEKKSRKQKKELLIGLAYEQGKPRIEEVRRMSKPSRRQYAGAKNLWRVRQGYGDMFLSTPVGVLSAREAKKKKVGGEVLFEVW